MSTDLRSTPPASPIDGAAVPERDRSSSLGIRQPGLDGLRGVAVSGVLLFHAGISWAVGGFLGVSMFFTLSGFLITGVLLRNHQGERHGLRSFWGRRIRRLMPAAFVALAAIVVFGATVATRQQAEDLPAQIAAAATWTANWQFIASGTSYIDLFAAPSPVQHFWSLAIEEQLYLVLPLAVLFLIRRTRSSWAIGGALTGAALLSSAWMFALYEGGASLDRLYYGTDTRMAELLVGGALAVVISRTGLAWSTRLRQVLGVTGLVALVAILWCWVNVPLGDGGLWKGGFLAFALLSCAVIVGVLARWGPLIPLLSWGPLPKIGRISYGLYLYHWPVYLWLTEARTGLSLWPLLALRLAVTFTAAILSYRYLEQPILHGASLGLSGRARYAVVPLAIVAVVVAGFVTVSRSGDDPLATLRADAASLAMPRESSDGVLDLLVIPERADDPVIAALEHKVRGNPSVKLTVADPFRCTGGLVATRAGETCAGWARSWPDLVKRHDPDAVLLYIDDWAGDDLGRLTGAPPRQQADAAAKIVGPGLDLLTARGAPIVWGTSNLTPAVEDFYRPLNQGLLQLEAQRSDIYRTTGASDANGSVADAPARNASKLLADASLHQRSAETDLPRVMVVGDSQSLSLGYGLERWAAQNDRALVWNRGIEGCGVVVEGEVRVFGAADSGGARCREVTRAWPKQVRAFRPDLVVVLSSLSDVQDRKIPGSSEFRSIGDPKFDAFLERQYERVIDTLSATGAQVVWMTAPCVGLKPVAGQEFPYDTGNIDHLNTTILTDVQQARPGLGIFDLAKIVCPNGKPLEQVDRVEALRPDGVHYSVDGALWFARKYGDRLLERAGP